MSSGKLLKRFLKAFFNFQVEDDRSLTMDEFDNMSEFSPFTWQPIYSDGSSGELMDFSIDQQSQFSTSRGILETIVEETSDDEENLYSGNWSGSDSFSSGSSETGSVVRVDVAAGE
jgi:hypothetical protein